MRQYGVTSATVGTNLFTVPYNFFLLQTGTPINAADGVANFHWLAGDFNHDGIVDLIGIKVTNTGTGTVEAHTLIGATNFQGILLETGTPIAEADGGPTSNG